MAGVEDGGEVATVIAGWRARGVSDEAAAFARGAVAATHPCGAARARSLLWACSRMGAWAAGVGLNLSSEVVFHPSVIERYVMVGMALASESARRTARANLRFVARRTGPALAQPPEPIRLSRSRAKAPYAPAEIDAFFALAAAQPTEARRWRLVGLLCLGLGAGLAGGELRAVSGRHVIERSGGVVVVVEGRRARAVPVLERYQAGLVASAAFAGEGFICGGTSPTRKNLTSNLVASIVGGTDLPRLEVPRLRATWLAGHLERLGLAALLAAAGVVCSQRLGDLAAHMAPYDEEHLVALLGARR